MRQRGNLWSESTKQMINRFWATHSTRTKCFLKSATCVAMFLWCLLSEGSWVSDSPGILWVLRGRQGHVMFTEFTSLFGPILAPNMAGAGDTTKDRGRREPADQIQTLRHLKTRSSMLLGGYSSNSKWIYNHRFLRPRIKLIRVTPWLYPCFSLTSPPIKPLKLWLFWPIAIWSCLRRRTLSGGFRRCLVSLQWHRMLSRRFRKAHAQSKLCFTGILWSKFP